VVPIMFEPWLNMSESALLSGSEEIHECERARCAMVFVFLNILQIAHESCTSQEIALQHMHLRYSCVKSISLDSFIKSRV